jgi:hypothetical protein
MNATCLTHLILLGATSKLVKSSFYQLNGFTYRTGLVPMVRITLRAMRLCKLQCSTAIAVMRPPAQYLTSLIMTIKLNQAVLYQWFYAIFNIIFQFLVNINRFTIAIEGAKDVSTTMNYDIITHKEYKISTKINTMIRRTLKSWEDSIL